MFKRGLKRNIFQRIFGIPVTRPPADPECWKYTDGRVTVTLALAPELAPKGGAIRLEGKGLPLRLLVYRADDGALKAIRNSCGHKGRRVDPVPGETCLQCCSVNAAAYEYSGEKLHGPRQDPPVSPSWTRGRSRSGFLTPIPGQRRTSRVDGNSGTWDEERQRKVQ